MAEQAPKRNQAAVQAQIAAIRQDFDGLKTYVEGLETSLEASTEVVTAIDSLRRDVQQLSQTMDAATTGLRQETAALGAAHLKLEQELIDLSASTKDREKDLQGQVKALNKFRTGLGGTLVGRVREVGDGGAGLVGVTVVATLIGVEQPVKYAELTKPEKRDANQRVVVENGQFTFRDLPAGTYRVGLNDRMITIGNRDWVIADNAPAEFQVPVQAGAISETPNLVVMEDIHAVAGTVLDSDGRPLPFAAITIRDGGNRVVANFRADESGNYRYPAEGSPAILRPGTYVIRIDSGGSPWEETVVVNSIANRNLTRPGDPALARLVGYPFLTAEVDGQDGQWMAPARTPTMRSSIGAALRGVLGRTPTASDARGFAVALDQSFTCAEVNGHTVCEWVPRSVSSTIETGGPLISAQAMLYQRAIEAREIMLPILEGLTPLLPDADREDVAAVRSVVRTELTQLFEELGSPDGPRQQRVNDLLADVAVRIQDIENVFGLVSAQVKTVEEEADLANFLTFQEYFVSIQTSWTDFVVRRPKFFTSHLFDLSVALQVVAEAVTDVESAMDSVFLGPGKRKITPIASTPQGQPPAMTVDELLSWVETFASIEAPALIDEGGKKGASALLRTLTGLEQQVTAVTTGRTIPDPAASHPRVVNAFASLRQALQQALKPATEAAK